MNNARQTGAVLEAHFQFLQWLFPAIARFPRSQKLLLTDRIQSIALDPGMADYLAHKLP